MRLLGKDTQGKDVTLTSSPWPSSCPSSRRMLSFPARRIIKCRAAAQSQAGPGVGGAARGERTLPQTEVCVTTRAPRPSQREPKAHPPPPTPGLHRLALGCQHAPLPRTQEAVCLEGAPGPSSLSFARSPPPRVCTRLLLSPHSDCTVMFTVLQKVKTGPKVKNGI